MILILMGVSGAGKTTVGSRLALELGWKFLDADAFHSAENIAKMRAGTALNDGDRDPWLAALRAEIERALSSGESLVLACSALKESYRRQLQVSAEVKFVYLAATVEELRTRLKMRTGHYMTEKLLPSQMQALEVPLDAITVDATRPVEEVVAEIRGRME